METTELEQEVAEQLVELSPEVLAMVGGGAISGVAL